MKDQSSFAPLAIEILPSEHFRCQLDEQPGFLVPSRLLSRQPDPMVMRHLIVNPYCWFSGRSEPPLEFKAHQSKFDAFYWGKEALIVFDNGPARLLPYSIGERVYQCTKALVPGHPLPIGFPTALAETLLAARVLIIPEYEQLYVETWAQSLMKCAEMFHRDGYAPVAGMLHPFHIGALRRYYRYLIRKGFLRFGDRQCPERYAAHNEPVSGFFHHQLTNLVSAIVGAPVKPSYVYLVSYQGGAALPAHTDRAQCEFSVTLLIDCSPEPELESPWPIHLGTPNGVTTVFQAIGDGLVYRGRNLQHWRDSLMSEYTSTSLLFHYVNADFDGPLD